MYITIEANRSTSDQRRMFGTVLKRHMSSLEKKLSSIVLDVRLITSERKYNVN